MGSLEKYTILYFIVILFTIANTKDLHVKEYNLAEKENGYAKVKQFDNLKNYYEKARFARHVEMVTESIMEHLINEINKKYPDMKIANKNSTLPELIRRLKKKLKRHINKNRHKKHRRVTNDTVAITKANEGFTKKMMN